ncbi:MAG: hypothetical protein Q8927_11435 [Bacteroidota bacterium]|nr:hypothetical protein [Bacteroidota bacterium]MDP4216804.1 hypothetical protein [Bacteroidota bacterium]MDP4252903.1 hypothetical protein [Bacteroidota bacterium]MDP4259751.1 hypothetical protein [Bacteroidota bacterium]
MKKFVTTILALVYLTTSVGATIHWHYCMGKLISWGLTDRATGNCSYCGMPKSNHDNHARSGRNGCCKDEHKHIKLDKDQNLTGSAYKLPPLPLNIPATHPAPLTDTFVSAYTVIYPTSNAPPDPVKVPAFLRNRNFRI